MSADIERDAHELAQATGMRMDDARELVAKAGEITQPPAERFANTLRRDGAVIGTFKTWLDCFAAAQAMSAQFKRALFTADGAMGQHFAYRAGARSRKDEKR